MGVDQCVADLRCGLLGEGSGQCLLLLWYNSSGFIKGGLDLANALFRGRINSLLVRLVGVQYKTKTNSFTL